jgi:hypothetical protein
MSAEFDPRKFNPYDLNDVAELNGMSREELERMAILHPIIRRPDFDPKAQGLLHLSEEELSKPQL